MDRAQRRRRADRPGSSTEPMACRELCETFLVGLVKAFGDLDRCGMPGQVCIHLRNRLSRCPDPSYARSLGPTTTVGWGAAANIEDSRYFNPQAPLIEGGRTRHRLENR